MASIKFRLRSTANKNVSIKVRVSLGKNKQDLELNTGFTINPKDWSVSKQRPIQSDLKKRPTDKESAEIFDEHRIFKQALQENLNKLSAFVLKELNTNLGESIVIDTFWLESKINECFKRVVKNDTGLLINHTQYIIDNASTRTVGANTGLSKETIKSYVSFKKVVLEYQKAIKKQIQFMDLTAPFIEKFKIWMLTKKNYAKNTAGRKLQMLKTIAIDAEKNHEIPVTPYSKIIQHFGESNKDRYIQTLSFEELEQIKYVDLSNAEYLNNFKKENPELTKGLIITPETVNNARNWILLGCEIGQRGGDLLKITTENIRYKSKTIYIDIIQQKTNKNVTIGIIAPHVIDIIENQLPKEIPHQKLNDYVKVVCKLAGIDAVVKGTKLNTETNRKELGEYPKYELIASHCFRRSFATNYYKKIPTAVLIGITGHSKESLFLTYINEREDKDSNADLFMKFYSDLHKDKTPAMKVILNTGTK